MFKKGHSGNDNGRPKGAKNERTKEWEAFSTYCLTGGLKKFKEELEKLNGKDYITAFNNLLEYHAPKLARSEIKVEAQVTQSHTIKLPDGTQIEI